MKIRLLVNEPKSEMIDVVIVQYRLLHYRLKLFEVLRAILRQRGVNLLLVCGQPSETERLRKDEGTLEWADKVQNVYIRIAGKDIVWQPMSTRAHHAALVVVMQENRLISNYALQLRRFFGGPLVSFWGHGRNYQSRASTGLRERWKSWWLRRVDWWFAYTPSPAAYVRQHGFDASRITVLDNAIDVSGFLADLNGVSAADIAVLQQQLGISAASQVAIYCGSIYAEKRISVLLEAADMLRQRLPDFHLLVVGDGPEAGVVRAAADSRPWLHVRGIRKGCEKALDYRLASVMLNPGAVGLHIVDSFAARTPLITQASALHGPEYDYLVNGVNGVSVDEDSADNYANAVARLYTEPNLLTNMQARCAADAHRYTVERMAQNFAEGILACLRRSGRLPAAPVA